MYTGTGVSTEVDTEAAAQQAVTAAKNQMQGDPQIALVFWSSEYNPNVVTAKVSELLPEGVAVLGGSTAGEIGSAGPSYSHSIVVMLLGWGPEVKAAKVVCEQANTDGEVAGKTIGEELKQKLTTDPNFILMLSDGLATNPSAILRGLASVLPQSPVIGGSSGDDGKYKQTFQFGNGTAIDKSATAIGVVGPVKFSVGVRHGWTAISASKTVTKAEGTVVHEIDDKPAIQLYEEFVGKERAATLKEVTLAELALSYPLGVKEESSGEMLLRAPFYVDAKGSITCGGEVAEGSQVYLMMGNKDAAIEAAKLSAEKALQELGETPKAAIIFNCHVRDTLFASKDESKNEIDAIKSVIGEEVPLVGFYTYAEQAPLDGHNYNLKTCNNATHNETIVILLLA